MWSCLRNTFYIYTCTCEQDKPVKISKSEHSLPSRCPQSHWADIKRVDHSGFYFIMHRPGLILKYWFFFFFAFCTIRHNKYFSFLILTSFHLVKQSDLCQVFRSNSHLSDMSFGEQTETLICSTSMRQLLFRG